jgi:hypothetical protein
MGVLVVRKSFALIGVIVGMVGCTEKGSRPPLLKTPAASFESIEYKIRLAAPVSDAEAPEILLLVADDQETSTVKTKRCMQVDFLDGPGDELRSAGYALRRRAELEDRKCNGLAGLRGDLVLKLRSLSAVALQSSPEWGINGAKREEDVLIGRAADGQEARQSAWSLSFEVDTPVNPSSVGDVRDIFSGVLSARPKSLELSRGCRQVFERRWEIDLPKEAPGKNAPRQGPVKRWKLATWYRVDPSGKPGAALLTELSFDSSIENRAAAEASVARAMAALGSRVGPPESKTDAIYQCGSEAQTAM